MRVYEVGSLVHLSATFTQPTTGARLNPSTVALLVQDPSGFETPYTPNNISLGVYTYDIDVDTAGKWFYRFEATGTGKSANEDSFIVKTSEFE